MASFIRSGAAGAAAAAGSGMESIQLIISQKLQPIFSFVANFKQSAFETTDHVASKIDEYRGVMSGQNQNQENSDPSMFIMEAKQLEMVNEMRKDNPALYCIVASAADCWVSGAPATAYLKCAPNDLVNVTKEQAVILALNVFVIHKYLKTESITIKITPSFVSALSQLPAILTERAAIASFINRFT